MGWIFDGMTGFDLFSLIVNNGVVILIALFAFVYIDRRQIKRMKNQEEAAKILLRNVFNNCKKTVVMFDDEKFVKLIIKKTDFDKPITADDPTRILEDNAFKNESIVFDLFKEGLLSSDIFQAYIDMKQAFQMFMSTRITLYDAPEIWGPIRENFLEKYRDGLKLIQPDNSEKK